MVIARWIETNKMEIRDMDEAGTSCTVNVSGENLDDSVEQDASELAVLRLVGQLRFHVALDRRFLIAKTWHLLGHGSFVKYFNMTITKAAYKMLNIQGYMPGITAHLSICYIGRTSFIFKTTVTNAETGELLATHHTYDILVDPFSRKPKPLPDMWRGLEDHLKEKQKPFSVSSYPLREGGYHKKVQVIEKHLDQNGHVSYLDYMEMAMECIEEAFSKKFYHRTSMLSSIKDIFVLYESESLLGDNLDVYTWKSEGKTFIKILRDSLNIVTIYLTFHEDIAKI